MADTGWTPAAGAAVGAVIALAGTLVSSVRADRTQRSRDRESERLANYVDFALALDDAHASLRDVARSEGDAGGQFASAVQAVWGSRIYGVRERLLMSGTVEMVKAGESVFARLVEIRDAVRSGAALSSPAYHDAYHGFAEALWTFRVAARQELRQRPLVPGDLGRASWSERAECAECGPRSQPDAASPQ